jgi:hypothetical protein
MPPRLVWETVGLGVIEAWYRDDGSPARCIVRIVGSTAYFEITARRPTVDVFPPITLRMRHTEFDLERCQWLAEIVEAEYPIAANDERVLQDLIYAQRQPGNSGASSSTRGRRMPVTARCANAAASRSALHGSADWRYRHDAAPSEPRPATGDRVAGHRHVPELHGDVVNA